jgi:hypothetical protein
MKQNTETEPRKPEATPADGSIIRECPQCRGVGSFLDRDDGESPCHVCDGSGGIKEHSDLSSVDLDLLNKAELRHRCVAAEREVAELKEWRDVVVAVAKTTPLRMKPDRRRESVEFRGPSLAEAGFIVAVVHSPKHHDSHWVELHSRCGDGPAYYHGEFCETDEHFEEELLESIRERAERLGLHFSAPYARRMLKEWRF